MAVDDTGTTRRTVLGGAAAAAGMVLGSGAADAQGNALRIVEMPAPVTTHADDGIVDWSYINHYVCNGAVIMCTFDDANDDTAAALLAEAGAECQSSRLCSRRNRRRRMRKGCRASIRTTHPACQTLGLTISTQETPPRTRWRGLGLGRSRRHCRALRLS